MMSTLEHELSEIISSRIHQAKSVAFKGKQDDETLKMWKIIDSDMIADECVKKIKEIIELWMFVPCCHMSGMHELTHFDNRLYICESQKAEAFERFCKDFGINPVTKSKIDCGWCRDYVHYRKGEGMSLFGGELK